MRTKEALKWIIRQIVAGCVSVTTGMAFFAIDTKGYLGVLELIVFFATVGGALLVFDGILDIIAEFKCDPDYKKRWYDIDEEP